MRNSVIKLKKQERGKETELDVNLLCKYLKIWQYQGDLTFAQDFETKPLEDVIL